MEEASAGEKITQKAANERSDSLVLIAAIFLFLAIFAAACKLFADSLWRDCGSLWFERVFSNEGMHSYLECMADRGADFRSALGQFGDSVGGLMNPLIGLFTVFLFIRSLRQNQEMLRISQEEMIETRKAVKDATDAQEKMEYSLKQQIELAMKQNNFSNYYRHMEEFDRYISSSKNDSFPKLSVDKIGLHKTLFENGRYSDFHVQKNIQALYIHALLTLIKAIVAARKFESQKLADLDSCADQSTDAVLDALDRTVNYGLEETDSIRIKLRRTYEMFRHVFNLMQFGEHLEYEVIIRTTIDILEDYIDTLPEITFVSGEYMVSEEIPVNDVLIGALSSQQNKLEQAYNKLRDQSI